MSLLVRVIELRQFAHTHDWESALARAGLDPVEQIEAIERLLASYPCRRRVRALELAAIVPTLITDPADTDSGTDADSETESSTDSPQTGLEAALSWIVETLHAEPEVAFPVPSHFVVDRPAEPAPDDVILLASTPRCGNTLTHRLIAAAFDYHIVAVNSIDDLDPSMLTGRVLLQIHTPNDHRSNDLRGSLGARVLSVARHPLDALLSILHFARNEPQAAYWLDGAIPVPRHLQAMAPTSEAFVTWATGPGVRRLLGVTHSWWAEEATHRVYYEDLVGDLETTAAKMASSLHLRSVLGDGEPLAAKLVSPPSTNNHRWRGTPGGWQDLLPASAAERLYTAHRPVFDDLGYTIDNAVVSAEEADANWHRLKR